MVCGAVRIRGGAGHWWCLSRMYPRSLIPPTVLHVGIAAVASSALPMMHKAPAMGVVPVTFMLSLIHIYTHENKEPVIFLKPDSAILKDGKPFFIPDFSNEVH